MNCLENREKIRSTGILNAVDGDGGGKEGKIVSSDNESSVKAIEAENYRD